MALQWKTPSEGLTIGDVAIPADTTVWCSQYVIGRSASYDPLPSRRVADKKPADRLMPAGEEIHTDALRFCPERWYARPEMIKEPGAYAPFSLGTWPYIPFDIMISLAATHNSLLLRLFNPPFHAHLTQNPPISPCIHIRIQTSLNNQPHRHLQLHRQTSC